MNRFAIISMTLVACVSLSVYAVDNITLSAGEWVTTPSSVTQQDATELYARIDGDIGTSSAEVVFNTYYISGGYITLADAQNGEYHGGFGVHIGVSDPALGETSWGNGKSYLLWLNVDTRERTRTRMPEYYGLRFQVYKSAQDNIMQLLDAPELMEQYPDLNTLTPSNYFSVDLIEGIKLVSGRSLSIQEILSYYQTNPLHLRIKYARESGEVRVYNPVNPSQYFMFHLDPEFMQGSFASLRTNRLALQFRDVTVR